ncbi:unnamed protein product [Moneuplotes crassus]|uniref:Uncharacterized protein n=1 Tax=Euplotes crassus TaxID=5936 RepID=A0AAD1XFF6_EUPCR|nr:unnamed protein product [Moneuplotes crassus]
MKGLTIFFLLAIVALSLAENPALVAVIEKPIIDKARDKYFTSVVNALGTLTLEDFKEGAITATDIRVEISNDASENLNVAFDNESNFIRTEIKNTNIRVKVNYKYKAVGVLPIKGTADISGPLDSLALAILMGKAEDGDFIIPQIAVPEVSLSMTNSKFKVKLTCKGCLKPVESLITTFMKGTLLNKVKGQVKDQVPTMAEEIGNGILTSSYPRTFPLLQDIRIVTALTDAINVAEDHLEIPFDGTIYTADKGIIRPGPTPDMPRYNPESPGEAQMFFSSYLTETLSNTLNTLDKLVLKTRFLLLTFVTTIDPSKGKTSVSFDDGAIVARLNPKIVTKNLKLGFELGTSVKVSLNIKPGDSKNLLSVVPKIKKMSLNSFKVILFGLPIDLSLFKFFITPIVRLVLNFIVLPKIEIPKSDLLSLTVTDSLLAFRKEYAEFGISFDFTQ